MHKALPAAFSHSDEKISRCWRHSNLFSNCLTLKNKKELYLLCCILCSILWYRSCKSCNMEHENFSICILNYFQYPSWRLFLPPYIPLLLWKLPLTNKWYVVVNIVRMIIRRGGVSPPAGGATPPLQFFTADRRGRPSLQCHYLFTLPI